MLGWKTTETEPVIIWSIRGWLLLLYWVKSLTSCRWVYITSFVMSSNVKCKEKNSDGEASKLMRTAEWLIDYEALLCPPLPPPPPTSVSMCAVDDANGRCSLRPDHKPVERSQQGGNSITQRALQWLDGAQGTLPCDVTRAMWNHLAGKSQMCLTGGGVLKGMDLALSSRRSENVPCDKQFATTRQQISEFKKKVHHPLLHLLVGVFLLGGSWCDYE